MWNDGAYCELCNVVVPRRGSGLSCSDCGTQWGDNYVSCSYKVTRLSPWWKFWVRRVLIEIKVGGSRRFFVSKDI